MKKQHEELNGVPAYVKNKLAEARGAVEHWEWLVLHWHNDATQKRQLRTQAVMRQAVKLEHARTNGAGPQKKKLSWAKARLAQRKRTAKILAKLSKTEPRAILGTGIAANLLRNGLIQKKGEGPKGIGLYIRSDRPFDPSK